MADEENRNVPNDGPGKGTASSPESVTLPQPPASNPGAGDPSAGIAKDAGGISSTAHVESPVPNADTTTTIVDTVKSFLGLGLGEKKAEETEARNAGAVGATIAATSATALASSPSASGNTSQTFTAEVPDRTRTTAVTATTQNSEPAASTSQGDQYAKDSTSTENKQTHTQTMADTGAAAATSTFDEPVDSPIGKARTATNARGKSTAEREEPDTHKPPQPAGPDGGVSKGKGSLENRDAIPTAGGQRLGEEHWGESQIVPDVPKPAGEEGGVASSHGQPNDETAANTAKNTGGASGGPPGSGEKQGFADKIKDKLNIGKKE